MDPRNLEYAARHAEINVPLPWQAETPLEAAMRHEEETPREDVRADIQEVVLCYVFADAMPEEWQTVAVRAHALLAGLWPALIAGRSSHEAAAAVGKARQVSAFRLGDVRARFEPVDLADFEKVMAYFFPPGGQWLLHGVQNLYLVARLYQPGLVTRWRKDLSYEQLAQVFGELPMGPHGVGTETPPEDTPPAEWLKMCGRARSRWSARAQSLIARKIVANGGRRPGMFGKGADVAEKLRAAAMGNQNRLGGPNS